MAEREALRAALGEKQRQLEALSGGAARLVRTEAHRSLLFEVARTVVSELTIFSARVNARTLDDELCKALAAGIGKGATVRIAWGFGTRGRETDRNRVRGDGGARRPRAQGPEGRPRPIGRQVH